MIKLGNITKTFNCLDDLALNIVYWTCICPDFWNKEAFSLKHTSTTTKRLRGGVGDMPASQVPRQKTRRLNGSWLRGQVKAKTRKKSTRNWDLAQHIRVKVGKGRGRSWGNKGTPSSAPRTADSPQKQGAPAPCSHQSHRLGIFSCLLGMTEHELLHYREEQVPGGLRGPRFTRRWCSGVGNGLNTILDTISGKRRVSYKRVKRFMMEV